MMDCTDPDGRSAKWRLSLSNFHFKVIYRAGFKNQVPGSLSRCVPEYIRDNQVEDDIHNFESIALEVIRAQAEARDATERIAEDEQVDP